MWIFYITTPLFLLLILCSVLIAVCNFVWIHWTVFSLMCSVRSSLCVHVVHCSSQCTVFTVRCVHVVQCSNQCTVFTVRCVFTSRWTVFSLMPWSYLHPPYTKLWSRHNVSLTSAEACQSGKHSLCSVIGSNTRLIPNTYWFRTQSGKIPYNVFPMLAKHQFGVICSPYKHYFGYYYTFI